MAALPALTEPVEEKVDPNKPPVRMDINSTPRHVCQAWDVFFNGQRQRACIIADREKGYIKRYKLAIGSMPVRGRSGTYETEELHGKVEFKLKEGERV
jgi:hypothetical protein